jgi:glycosyltransferase involved in cell wall biosynthesis
VIEAIASTKRALQADNARYPEKRLRIAQVAPLAEAVPPHLYGGTERVVSLLTEELVRRGHEVTLFASGDSQTSAKLFSCAERAIRLDPRVKDDIAPTLMQLGEVYRLASDFDVIHNHVDYFAFPFARLSSTPTVTTTHGRLDLPEVRKVYREFPEQKLISISRDQATWLPEANWVASVYNSVDPAQFTFRKERGSYLAFLGRMSFEKRPDRAIEIARDVGMRLLMAAKVDAKDQPFFDAAVKPLIDSSPLVEFIGEVNDREKDELLGGAYACLFPIDWPEPFGITMIEALATGTPVISTRSGSVPEVIVHGVTGYVCDSLREMVEAVAEIGNIDRANCRAHVERKFSATVMAHNYEAAYRSAIAASDANVPVPSLDLLASLEGETPADLRLPSN